jgi:D-alanyl-D-alanine-carboxypeptidase/D-alanyl-D-alanine-endopeptidase
MLNRRSFTTVLAAAAIAGTPRAWSKDTPDVSDDHTIRDILKRRIDLQKRSVGMAVCVVTPARKRFVTWGRERSSDTRPVTPETVFEIGSITKVFTALLLANMARRGELGLDDPVANHLPADWRVPGVNGRPITLADLATHTSGLPRMPTLPGEPLSPQWREAMNRFSIDELKGWVAEEHPPPPAEAGGWWYSNAGYALLGFALAHRGGRPYETLLKERVIAPLGLRDTTHHPTVSMKSRLADGHDSSLNPIPAFDGGIFAPAGNLRSTPRDLAKFIAAIQPGSHSRLEPDAQLLLTVRRPAPWIGGQQALGWEVRDAPGGSFVTKDGVTFGQTASIVFDPDTRVGVAVLSNTFPDLAFSHLSSGGVGASDIAQHLLRPQIPMEGKGGTSY